MVNTILLQASARYFQSLFGTPDQIVPTGTLHIQNGIVAVVAVKIGQHQSFEGVAVIFKAVNWEVTDSEWQKNATIDEGVGYIILPKTDIEDVKSMVWQKMKTIDPEKSQPADMWNTATACSR